MRHQGYCGSCYALATADALSSMNSIYRFGFFISLSTQQLLDCPNNGLTFGCQGGFLEGAYSYMQYAGITTDFAYSYTASKGPKCKFNGGGAFKISSFSTIPPNCDALI